MSDTELAADVQADLAELTGAFADGLAQVLESMTDARPEATHEAVGGTWAELQTDPAAEILWWAQPFQAAPAPALWVATPRPTWEALGTRTLRAAGLETVELAEARNTWQEILSQALAALARATGSVLGEEVTCQAGSETAAPDSAGGWVRVELKYGDDAYRLFIRLAPALVEQLEAHAAWRTEQHPESASAEPAGDSRRVGAQGRTMELLLDVELPVSISFGRTRVPLKDVLKLTTGSIVELNRAVSEPVEILVNHTLIAKGEVVVVDGNYGVRIQRIVSQEDRLRSLR